MRLSCWVRRSQTRQTLSYRGGQGPDICMRWLGRVHHLSCLSNLYKRARAERVVPSGYDPVGDFDEKPPPARGEAKWLEIPDAALLLEAARIYRPTPGKGGWRPVPFAHSGRSCGRR
jgi:hypothetical protein